jgi:hypothetical protein
LRDFDSEVAIKIKPFKDAAEALGGDIIETIVRSKLLIIRIILFITQDFPLTLQFVDYQVCFWSFGPKRHNRNSSILQKTS